jgi:hypothetical protein
MRHPGLVPGVIESSDFPEDGPRRVSSLRFRVLEESEIPAPSPEDVEDYADRLRFMGIDEARVRDFEERAQSDFVEARRWIHAFIETLPHPPEWTCDCGEPLVDDEWRGHATIRCSECGARWGLEVVGAGGRQWNIDGPSEEWLAAHPDEPDDSGDDHEPDAVIVSGLPPLIEGIGPGMSFPLATYDGGPWGAVLYVTRALPGDFDLPGDEYMYEIEHLVRDPEGSWTTTGSGGGGWVNPFAPPQLLLAKYVVLGTGVSSTSDGETTVTVTGGLCSAAVKEIEVEEGNDRERVVVDPSHPFFLVGSCSPRARVRILGHDGTVVEGHRGRLLEFDLHV